MAPVRYELGVTFTYKVSEIANASASHFGMPGASLDGVVFGSGRLRDLGLALDFSGESATSIKPGVNLSQISIVAGPRFRMPLNKDGKYKTSLYVQALGGEVFAFNSVFPVANGAASSASSAALQLGGGFNMRLTRKLGLRLVEADYVGSYLPNNGTNVQNDLRLSSGLTFHF